MMYFLLLLALVATVGYAYAAHVTLSILMQSRPKPILLLPFISPEQAVRFPKLAAERLRRDYHLMAVSVGIDGDHTPKIISTDNSTLTPELRSLLFEALNHSERVI